MCVCVGSDVCVCGCVCVCRERCVCVCVGSDVCVCIFTHWICHKDRSGFQSVGTPHRHWCDTHAHTHGYRKTREHHTPAADTHTHTHTFYFQQGQQSRTCRSISEPLGNGCLNWESVQKAVNLDLTDSNNTAAKVLRHKLSQLQLPVAL